MKNKTNQVIGMNTISNEILERIIFYEGPKKETFDELLRKREVCRKWDLLIGNNKRLWKSLCEQERGADTMNEELNGMSGMSGMSGMRTGGFRYDSLFYAYYEWITYERFGCIASYCTNVATSNAIQKVRENYCSDCDKQGPWDPYID
jgi:hypothetical protein